jgi:glycosyltransferase involved in cell wall biosynthesis
MSSDRPLVSIGVPAYNGERYIRQTLDSLLAQDYENFELIISDNVSTDRTAEICQEYLAKDGRVQYYRNETNLGSVKNFNRLFELSSGKYFMWAADHDLWHPTFISNCVSALEEEPEVVLAYSRTMLIDLGGNPLRLLPDQIDTRGMPTVRRYKHLIWNLVGCNMMYGVIRREALGQTGRFRNVWGADHLLLAELALRGTFAQIAEPLFCRRRNRLREDPETRKKRVLSYMDPMNAAEKSKLSYQDLWLELCDAHLQVVASAPMGFLEKLHVTMATVLCFRSRFGMRGYGALSAERMVKLFIPKDLKFFHSLQRL